jgi:MGT family glycosyltransferase
MRRVLIYTSPARGHLYPMMDVALELRRAGHRVVVQTLAGERARVEGAGVEHRAIAPAIERITLDDHRSGNPLAALKATFDAWLARAPHEIDDLRAACDEIDPDILVIDVNTWGAAAFAESQTAPWALFLPYVLPLASHDTPAFGPGLAPPRNGLDRLRDRLLRGLMDGASRSHFERLDRLRAQLGLSGVGSYDGLFARPKSVLYRTAPPFDYPRDPWPAHIHPLGPGLWAPPEAVPAWWHDLPRPIVLVNVSTEFQDDGAIIEAALQGLADEPGSVVVTTSALDPERFTPPHERVRLVRFLPHAQVMPDADVVVTHGGMGSTQRALAAGVPTVVVPWGRDQSETGRRVALSGAGVMLPRAKLTPQRLREAVAEARTRRPQAEAIARAFAEAGGAARCVTLLEGLMDRVPAEEAVRPVAQEREPLHPHVSASNARS